MQQIETASFEGLVFMRKLLTIAITARPKPIVTFLEKDGQRITRKEIENLLNRRKTRKATVIAGLAVIRNWLKLIISA